MKVLFMFKKIATFYPTKPKDEIKWIKISNIYDLHINKFRSPTGLNMSFINCIFVLSEKFLA